LRAHGVGACNGAEGVRDNRRFSILFQQIKKGFRRHYMTDDKEDKTTYKVVLNHEEQYSIWPALRENALGWRDAGKSGTKQQCLEFIKEVWTDMRPLSLRKKMQEHDPL
jgi:MbtH protein